jgi:hypothetical protein
MNHEERPQESRGTSGDSAPSPLESAESHVARGTRAGHARDGGGKEFQIAFRCLVEWGEARGLISTPETFPFFGRRPDAHGQEHEAWFVESSNRWFKATYPNRFGMAWGKRESASAREYLTRLALQNRYFSDDLQLVALINFDKRLRVLTSQPHIEGRNASPEEIKNWFLDY